MKVSIFLVDKRRDEIFHMERSSDCVDYGATFFLFAHLEASKK